MAKYIKPPNQPRILGSIEGNTFQRCGRVFSIRSRTKPVNKNTVKQSQSRNKFTAAVSRWRNLTETEKSSWESEKVNYPRLDSLGNQYILTGQQLQSSSNINTAQSRANPINSIPPAGALPELVYINSFIYLDFEAVFLLYSPLVIPEGCFLRNEFSRPMVSPMIEPSFNDYFIVRTRSAGDNQSDDLFNAVKAKFGIFNQYFGWYFYTRTTLFDLSTGQMKSVEVRAIRIDE